tara:strand:- start:767 stop:961 length:195 start_codon:yes stop_codon:yes gene_type:complete
MIKIGLQYRKEFAKGDIYEVIKMEKNIARIRNNSFPDEKDDRYKWVSIMGLENSIKAKNYSVIN